MDRNPVHIIGGGLAGCEAAWQLAQAGVHVILHEMRPIRNTQAHRTQALAELVCSNSFRSDDAENNAVGLLHEEMRRAGSLILFAGDQNRVPAGGALAVDREGFSTIVTEAIENHKNILIIREEISEMPPADWQSVIIATGPLTSDGLADSINKESGLKALAFFDAIAPIVDYDSIDMEIAWRQSRYDKIGPSGTEADYINCPLNIQQYQSFITALRESEQTDFKQWERDTPYFEACLPIEIMAARGTETLRFGPMKPVGLTNPHSKDKPYAVVQLRQDNKLGSLYNMVGFQTKMKYGAQLAVFRTIPGLEQASFARLGGIHRNSFINSPILLDSFLRLKTKPYIRFAGQITGVEGYVESAAIGLIAGKLTAAEHQGRKPTLPPVTTALGALLNHITGGARSENFQPMNVNFGLFPPLVGSSTDSSKNKGRTGRKIRNPALASRALNDLDCWLDDAACNLKISVL